MVRWGVAKRAQKEGEPCGDHYLVKELPQGYLVAPRIL